MSHSEAPGVKTSKYELRESHISAHNNISSKNPRTNTRVQRVQNIKKKKHSIINHISVY